MHERLVLSGTGHSETANPVDASNCLMVLPDMTKRWLLNQRRPVPNNGVTFTGRLMSKLPLSLSQSRTKFLVAVTIRSPCGEYLAALITSPCSSICTFLRVAMSQMEAVPLLDAETRRDESSEKSTHHKSCRNMTYHYPHLSATSLLSSTFRWV